MKPKKKHPKQTGRVTLTSPVGIPREYQLPEDRIRTLASVQRHYAEHVQAERKREKRENRVIAARFTPEEEAEIQEKVREEILQREELLANAYANANLPEPKFQKVKQGWICLWKPTDFKKHERLVKKYGFRAEDIRAAIEAEYV